MPAWAHRLDPLISAEGNFRAALLAAQCAHQFKASIEGNALARLDRLHLRCGGDGVADRALAFPLIRPFPSFLNRSVLERLCLTHVGYFERHAEVIQCHPDSPSALPSHRLMVGHRFRRFFQAAIKNENRAKEAVRITALVATDATIQVTGKLSPREVELLSLAPGEVRSIRRTIPLPSGPANASKQSRCHS